MNGLSYNRFVKPIVFSFVAILFLMLTVRVFAGGGLVSFETTPNGPLNPGDQYQVRVTVYADNSQTSLCRNCPVKFRFEDATGQAGDEILPRKTTTNSNGQVTTLVTAFALMPDIGGRYFYTEVTLPDGSIYTSAPLLLSYRNIPVMGAMRLFTKTVSRGIKLPPMGNIYPYVIQQKYSGGDTRQVYLQMNHPFGTKKYSIFIFSEKDGLEPHNNDFDSWYQQHFFKDTAESSTIIKVPAFENLRIDVVACSANITGASYRFSSPCVGPSGVQLAKLENIKTASGAAEITILGDEIAKQQAEKSIAQEKQSFVNNVPDFLRSWLENLYTAF